MLNPNLKLNPDVFNPDVKQVPIRAGFGDGLLIAGRADERIVALCADLTDSTKMNLFRDAFPDRFIQVGVAEQNLASVASGLAAVGKIPFISSYAMFSPGRNWEQIRTTICYNDVPVKIAGSHAGVSVGPDGGTHQALEDIAITRVIPNMCVICPCDAIEARKATLAAAVTKTPTYIRLAREKTPIVTTDDTPFEIGRAQVLFASTAESDKTIAIIATGSLVHNALLAGKALDESGISVVVVNMATIKPLDTEFLGKLLPRTAGLVTVEEHQIAGGMGSAVAEYVVQSGNQRPIEFIGVHDRFGQSGTPTELIEYYGMGVSHIVDAAKKILTK
jgi:transketolase